MNHLFKYTTLILFSILCLLIINNKRNESHLNRNKQNVLAFYDLMFNQAKPGLAVERYVGRTYTQHNPLVKDGKQGFIDYFEKMKAAYPEKKVIFKKVIAEDNYVVLHCLQIWPGDRNYATIDIFKLNKDSKIIEHWDTIQAIPDKSENSNTLF